MATHPQNMDQDAPVDEGVAEIVSVLNSVDGLETLQSCQGDFDPPPFALLDLECSTAAG